MPQDVIIVDVDSTIMDVSQRMKAALRDVGAKPGKNPQKAIDKLDPKKKSRFYRVFMSNRYTHLDKPRHLVVNYIRRLHKKTGLPTVIMTGQRMEMTSAKDAAVWLTRAGIPVLDVVQKTPAQTFVPGPKYKVQETYTRKLNPVHVVDDDKKILDAFKKAFPGVKGHRL